MSEKLSRRNFLQYSAMGTGAAVVGGVLPGVEVMCADPNQAKQPNIVLFIADDHGWSDYGFMGEKNIRTPHLDALREQSLLLTNVHTCSAMCAPSRSALYTGRYPMKNGCYYNHGTSRSDIQSLPHYLGALGYDVILAGKTHIKPKKTYPFEYIGFEKSRVPHQEIREALQREKPVCIVYASNEPHAPHKSGAYQEDEVTVPPNLYPSGFTKRKRADYWTDCTLEDDELGVLLKTVEHSGEKDKTCFIYTSDHGYSTMAKWTCYDAGLKVTTLVRWPGVTKPRSSADALISFVDFTPTFIEIAGGKAVNGLDGQSFLPLLKGESEDHHKAVFGLHTNQGISNGLPYPTRAIRTKKYHLIMNLNHEGLPTNVANFLKDQSLRKPGDLASWTRAAADDPKAQERIHAFTQRPAEELYRVQDDPWELKNLSEDSDYAEIKAELKKELFSWMENQGDKGMKSELKVKPRFRDLKKTEMR